MRAYAYFLPLTFLILVFTFFGCSEGSTAIVPDNTNANINTVPIIDLYEGDSFFAAEGLMGAYELEIDFDTLEVELFPMRVANLGESYIVNGINFFTLTPCSNCLTLSAIRQDGNHIILGFQISHPFEPGDVNLPPKANNRLDLDVFDLAMIVAPLEKTAIYFSLSGVEIYPDIVAEADGYTTELANVIGEPAALPFSLVVDESAISQHTWNEFPMGGSKEFEVAFQLENDGTSMFELYLTMAYGAAAKKATFLEPKYFNPEFNRKAPWKIIVSPTNEIHWKWGQVNTAGFNVYWYDWQAYSEIFNDPESFFEEAPLDYVYKGSSFSNLTIEFPGMTSIPAPVDRMWDQGGTGQPTAPHHFEYLLTCGDDNLSIGKFPCLVTLTDTRECAKTDSDRDYVIDTPDGISLEPYEIPLDYFKTYQIIYVDVHYPVLSYSADPDPNNLDNYGLIDFTISADGPYPIAFYEIDYDYDGVTFEADATSTDGVFNNVGPYVIPDGYTAPYTINTAFRATDTNNPPSIDVFKIQQVTIVNNFGPVVGSIIVPSSCPITLGMNSIRDYFVNATGVVDPITLYEMDYDYDGVTFEVDQTSTDGWFYDVGYPGVLPTCSTPFEYTVAFRGTDSCTPPNIEIFASCVVNIPHVINGSIVSPVPCPDVMSGGYLAFEVFAESFSGESPISLYEVDFDYDGNNFSADGISTDGAFATVGPFFNPNCGVPPNDPIVSSVAFRATDSCDPSNSAIFTTCWVSVLCP